MRFPLIPVLLLALLSACSGPREPIAPPPPAIPGAEQIRQQARAGNVEIIRDDFGVAHVYGQTDADAVFGLMYAQAEDDFPRVERNYIWALGRLAEVEGESARVVVSDEGIGIPEELHDEVFLEFVRAPNAMSHAAGGTGLGLSIVKEGVEMHGGQVSVQSSLGEGARFTVTLPLHYRPPEIDELDTKS